MTFKITTRHHRSPGTADCEGCTIDPDATRDTCRAHARETGHTVHYLIEDSTTYKAEPAA